jgi:hypothetical protein
MTQEAVRCYILIADEHSWKTSLNYNLWGLSERTKGSWNTTQVGDWVAFYVTRPTSKIVGFGKIARKFIDEEILWPDELMTMRPIWKYRLKLNIIYVLEKWEEGIPVPPHILLNTGRKVLDRRTFVSFIETADRLWGTTILSSFEDNKNDAIYSSKELS